MRRTTTLQKVRRSALAAICASAVACSGLVMPASGAETTDSLLPAGDARAAEPKPGTTLTMRRAARGVVVAGDKVAFNVEAKKSLVGKRVTLQRRVGSGGWIKVAKRKVPKSKKFAISGVATGVGRNSWRAVAVTKKPGKPRVVHRSKVGRTAVHAWFYLADLPMVDSDRFTTGSRTIGGTTYPRSAYNKSDFWWNHKPWGEWNLSYRCRTFKATIGIHDESASGYKVGFVSYLDGAETKHGSKGLGEGADITFDVASILRIRLEDQYIAGPTGSGSGYGWGVWGDARVLCKGKP